MSSNGRRKRNDDLLVAALASGKSIPQAAETTGLSARTINRRLTDPDFVKRVNNARSDLYTQAARMLAAAAVQAGETLISLLGSETESIRLKAANSLLGHCSKMREMLDVNERLAVLEGRLHGRQFHTSAR